MEEENVRHKAAGGMIWTTLQRFAGIGIQFISGIILARLLLPEDYGCIGMLAIFMTVATVFMDGGFGSALIQKHRPTQEDYSTIFWWNMGMSVLLYFILYIIAPYLAKFYRMPILSNVLRAQGLVLIFSAISVIQVNQLQKQLQFKKIALVRFFSTAIALAVTILLAYKGFGVWSLVAQNLMLALVPSIAFCITNKWHPSLLFSKKSFKELFSFGAFMFLTHVINAICNNIQGLLIGRFYNAQTMGYYSKGRSVEGMATNSISEALKQVTFPLYAEFQKDLNALADIIIKMTNSVSFVTYPIIFILILIAKPAFLLLYSERWLSSVHYFQVLCLAGLGTCLTSLNLQAIAAIGKSKLMFEWTIYKRIASIALIVAGMWIFGIEGLLWAVVIQSWMNYLVNAYLVSKHIGYKFSRQMLDMMPILLISVLAFVICLCVNHFVQTSIYILAVLDVVIYAAVYIGLSYLFQLDALSSIRQMAVSIRRKKNNR